MKRLLSAFNSATTPAYARLTAAAYDVLFADEIETKTATKTSKHFAQLQPG